MASAKTFPNRMPIVGPLFILCFVALIAYGIPQAKSMQPRTANGTMGMVAGSMSIRFAPNMVR